MKITREWIKANARKDGQGWNKKQLEVVGVEWPPSSGWIERIVGGELSDEKARLFESLKGKSIEGMKIDKYHAGGYDYPTIYTKPHSGSWVWSYKHPREWPERFGVSDKGEVVF